MCETCPSFCSLGLRLSQGKVTICVSMKEKVRSVLYFVGTVSVNFRCVCVCLCVCVCVISESAGENACGKDYDPFSPNSSGRSTPSSLYMESSECDPRGLVFFTKMVMNVQNQVSYNVFVYLKSRLSICALVCVCVYGCVWCDVSVL